MVQVLAGLELPPLPKQPPALATTRAAQAYRDLSPVGIQTQDG